METEVGPEAVSIRKELREGPATDFGDAPSSWHLIDRVRASTWCGLAIGYGNRRQLWSDTPEHQRCQTCLSSLRGMPG